MHFKKSETSAKIYLIFQFNFFKNPIIILGNNYLIFKLLSNENYLGYLLNFRINELELQVNKLNN